MKWKFWLLTVQMKAGWLRFGANIIDGIIIGNPTGILSVFMSIFFEWSHGIRGKDNGSFIFTHA
ncbi:hypothetical protein UP17_06825 [Peribacillus simplex]|nr:hypothetical protein UP17_06825 [Peribacillus simplex]